MKRRNFLGMLGLAPVVAVVPAVAETRETASHVMGDPFVVEGDSVRMNIANIGTIISADGRVVMKADQIIMYS